MCKWGTVTVGVCFRKYESFTPVSVSTITAVSHWVCRVWNLYPFFVQSSFTVSQNCPKAFPQLHLLFLQSFPTSPCHILKYAHPTDNTQIIRLHITAFYNRKWPTRSDFTPKVLRFLKQYIIIIVFVYNALCTVQNGGGGVVNKESCTILAQNQT